MNFLLRHYVYKDNSTGMWIAFDETERVVGFYNSRRAALKRVKAHFDTVDILQLQSSLGV